MPGDGDGRPHGFEPCERRFVAVPGQCPHSHQPVRFSLCLTCERRCPARIDSPIAVYAVRVGSRSVRRFAGDDKPGEQTLVAGSEWGPQRGSDWGSDWIWAADVSARPRDAGLKTEEHSGLAAITCD